MACHRAGTMSLPKVMSWHSYVMTCGVIRPQWIKQTMFEWMEWSVVVLGLLSLHDDVIRWEHFKRHWPFARGIPRSPANSPHKSQRRGVFMFSLICLTTNCWVNNRNAGDLTRHRAHYDVTVMIFAAIMRHGGCNTSVIIACGRAQMQVPFSIYCPRPHGIGLSQWQKTLHM